MQLAIKPIAALALLAATTALPTAAQSGPHANHHPEAVPVSSPALSEGLARGTGSLLEVHSQDRILKLAHTPIEALGWPSMTMNFEVSEEVELEGFVPGDAIEFDFNPSQATGFRIAALRKSTGKSVANALIESATDDDKHNDDHGSH